MSCINARKLARREGGGMKLGAINLEVGDATSRDATGHFVNSIRGWKGWKSRGGRRRVRGRGRGGREGLARQLSRI